MSQQTDGAIASETDQKRVDIQKNGVTERTKSMRRHGSRSALMSEIQGAPTVLGIGKLKGTSGLPTFSTQEKIPEISPLLWGATINDPLNKMTPHQSIIALTKKT